MARERGPQCHVEGCVRSGLVSVYFPDDDPVKLVDFIDEDDEDGEGLLVCRDHGEMLGTVESYEGIVAPDVLFVTIDPARAEGWRLAVIVRQSGRHAVVLEAPSESVTA